MSVRQLAWKYAENRATGSALAKYDVLLTEEESA